ncbi:hypothetical protein FIBSPDRAFT_938982 [Athelia psychrophila]|uniref:Uncharacterized protein n=1 Tax=Athelia psychrophila TaxID=1759441 RepID=A0A165XD24_9AGAM|nr:hypothetical protein FIBSPDRAFT_938982 [Fibularhizoctonia sp. CBS 109695]
MFSVERYLQGWSVRGRIEFRAGEEGSRAERFLDMRQERLPNLAQSPPVKEGQGQVKAVTILPSFHNALPLPLQDNQGTLRRCNLPSSSALPREFQRKRQFLQLVPKSSAWNQPLLISDNLADHLSNYIDIDSNIGHWQLPRQVDLSTIIHPAPWPLPLSGSVRLVVVNDDQYAFSPISIARASSSSSSVTSNSGWTSSTEWGPGALTGKALVAIGEKALRVVEDLILRKKLRAYQPRFPHNDEDSFRGPDMDEMYNDILEMSRQDLYGESIRFRARKMLLIQVGCRQTKRLISALLEWPEEEIRLFMVSVFDEMSMFWTLPQWLTNRTFVSKWSSNGYFSSQADDEHHAAMPLLAFISELLEMRPALSQAMIDAGLLNVLLKIRICYSQLFNSAGVCNRKSHISFQASLRECLRRLAGVEESRKLVLAHPIGNMWPELIEEYPAVCDYRFISLGSQKQRLALWSGMEYKFSLVERRLCAINEIIHDFSAHGMSNYMGMCIELVELSSQDVYTPDIKYKATRALLRCMASGDQLSQAMKVVLQRHPHNKIRRMFSIWIRWLIDFGTVFKYLSFPELYSLLIPGASPHPGIPIVLPLSKPPLPGLVLSTLGFTATLLRSCIEARAAFLDANVFTLLLAIVDGEVRGAGAERPPSPAFTDLSVKEVTGEALVLLSELRSKASEKSFRDWSAIRDVVHATAGDARDDGSGVVCDAYEPVRAVFLQLCED